jgi:hypothetical protein
MARHGFGNAPLHRRRRYLAVASEDGGDPGVVMACAGDVPTLETVMTVSLLRENMSRTSLSASSMWWI